MTLSLSLDGPDALKDVIRDFTAFSERARVIFNHFQDRHLPITPRLAEGLAQIERLDQPALATFWGAAYERAGAAVDMQQSFGRSSIWRTAAAVFFISIAEPVLRRIADGPGGLLLVGPAKFDPSEIGSKGSSSDPVGEFRAYAERIEASVSAAVQDPDFLGKGFWLCAGLGLLDAMSVRPGTKRRIRGAGVFARHSSFTTVRRGVADVDRTLAELTILFEPDINEASKRIKRDPRPTRRAERERSGYRPKEGGVVGVVRSRRLEDLNDILHSELAMPKQIRVQRLFDEGFMVRHRPPTRRPARDLIVFGICEAKRTTAAACLAKAAWIDASMRIRLVLAQMRTEKSEICWCEFPSIGLHVAATSAEGLNVATAANPLTINGDIRRRMILRMSLIPGIFDQKATKIPDEPLGDGSADRRGAARHAMLEECWRQRTSPTQRNPLGQTMNRSGAFSSRLLSMADYACGFALTIRDGTDLWTNEIVQPDWRIEGTLLGSELGLTEVAHANTAMILLPKSLKTGESFRLFTNARDTATEITIREYEDSKSELTRLYGELVPWIVETTLETLYGRR